MSDCSAERAELETAESEEARLHGEWRAALQEWQRAVDAGASDIEQTRLKNAADAKNEEYSAAAGRRVRAERALADCERG